MDAFVGIDVGKGTLEVAISGTRQVHRLPNTPDGWTELIALLAPARQPCIVLEATSHYHDGVATALAEAGKPVTIANPLHTAAFRRSEGQLAKTDTLDARVLVRFAEQKQPPPTPRPDPAQRHLRDLERARADLVETRVRTRLQASAASPQVAAAYAQVVATLSAQITGIEAALAAAIAHDPVLAQRDALLQSLPGLGPIISAGFLANLPELGTLDRRQIASLAGLAPRNQQSGRRTGRPSVWGGRAPVRQLAYLLAMSTIQIRRSGTPARGAEVIRARYDRLLARGKPPRLALLAIARWLITILNVMLRDGLRWEATRAAQGGGTA
jgi:transposase